MNRNWTTGACALVLTMGIWTADVRAQDEATPEPPAEAPAAEAPADTGTGEPTTPEGAPETAPDGAPGGEGAANFAPTEAKIEKEITPVLIQADSGGGAEGGADGEPADSEPTNLPAELGGGPIYRPGDLLADNSPHPAVGAAKKVLPHVPGANPGGPLNPWGPGKPAETLDRVMTPAANSINNALRGGGTPGAPSFVTSVTRPTGFWTSTPDVTLNINGTDHTIPSPSVSKGQTVSFYSVPQPGGGVQVEARSGNTRWTLERTGVRGLPDAVFGGWNWRQR